MTSFIAWLRRLFARRPWPKPCRHERIGQDDIGDIFCKDCGRDLT